ncbi:HAD-IA family hydrolase [Zoogloea sp.]|jgi:phosphoglycolate phosphatase|uniref:HAD-IA family hydrolase n=1 Tax=Zoogloea sp. TaxID=49181 RepID=UPI001B593F80|nr:HAD-IA family hydrolase [Zoogloea sp.]MBK6654506.1 HAD-IA family hydrolase [Zoogloea sp.]MBK7846665.1 HAD-IA family hydrolase [Zoogloea sp.]MBP7443524.1 HAD-IA family hydrolase [Zoogloea sp.]HOY00184.1 HAD-IA family hydrolase [Zoogloea sp.]HPI58811.1 HAD-IA family hydrolase [Zoogloea sp.]
MAKRFELIVFDWDGTLMDSAAAIVRAIQAASADLGLPVPPDARARHVIGLGLVDALRHAVPELAEKDYPAMVERYRHHYLSGDHELELFEGTHALIESLHGQGYSLAVATGKSRKGLARALGFSGLGRFFHATRCADECFSKPHPAMLEELMDELGVARGASLMIGDTTHDLQMARNAGVAGLAVSFGAHPVEQLLAEAPLACVHTPAELRAWLEAHA